jgi:hypothetical protein
MPLSGFSFETVVGLAIAVAFAVLCYRNMPRAILVFVGVAWIQFFQVASFAGSRISQGLLLVEFLATVMIGVWWLGRMRSRWQPLAPSAVNLPLLLMIPVAICSLPSAWAAPIRPLRAST